jgi:hypothetical protein
MLDMNRVVMIQEFMNEFTGKFAISVNTVLAGFILLVLKVGRGKSNGVHGTVKTRTCRKTLLERDVS